MRQASDGVTGSGNKIFTQAGKSLADDDAIEASAGVAIDGAVAATEHDDALTAALAIDGKSER